MKVERRKLPFIGLTPGELLAVCIIVLVFQIGESMAEGIPAPGSFTPLSFFWGVIRLLIIGAIIDRFVIRKGTLDAANRYKSFALFGLAVTALFAGYCWFAVRGQLDKGISFNQALGQASLWIVFASAGIICSAIVAYLAWFKPDSEDLKATLSGDYTRLYDERHLDVTRRSAQTALVIALTVLTIVVPMVELTVLHRYPVYSLAAAAMIGLSWLGAHAYWSSRI